MSSQKTPTPQPSRRAGGHRPHAADREHLHERLQSLRAIVPAFAEELATARRQAARLRVENSRLQEAVRELHRQRADSDARRPARAAVLSGRPVRSARRAAETPPSGAAGLIV